MNEALLFVGFSAGISIGIIITTLYFNWLKATGRF